MTLFECLIILNLVFLLWVVYRISSVSDDIEALYQALGSLIEAQEKR
jgi:hypothetical protein